MLLSEIFFVIFIDTSETETEIVIKLHLRFMIREEMTRFDDKNGMKNNFRFKQMIYEHVGGSRGQVNY